MVKSPATLCFWKTEKHINSDANCHRRKSIHTVNNEVNMDIYMWFLETWSKNILVNCCVSDGDDNNVITVLEVVKKVWCFWCFIVTRKDVTDPKLDSSENLKECTEESPLNRQHWGRERKKTFYEVNVVNLSLYNFFYTYVTIGDIFKVFSSKKFCGNILSHAQVFLHWDFTVNDVSMFLKIGTAVAGNCACLFKLV